MSERLNGSRSRSNTPPRAPVVHNRTPGSSARRGRRKESADNFHPKLITTQIVCIQCLHYVFLGFLFQINYLLFSTSITIDRIFTDKFLRIWKPSGWVDVLTLLLGSLFGSVLLALIVEKSKKCLDFSVTLFLLHLSLTTLYGGFPAVLDWWIIHILGTILMVVLGEYLCSRREMEDIPLLQL